MNRNQQLVFPLWQGVHMPALAYIGVGSNIDAEANIRHALALLVGQVELTGLSTFYRTAPIGRSGQPAFINGVAAIRTQLAPRDVKFTLLRGIEQELGRVRGEDKYAPRPIDLDLLLYDELVHAEEGLLLPDPEIVRRPFLAIPLCELDAGLCLPGCGIALAELAATLPRAGMEPLPALTLLLRKEFSHES